MGISENIKILRKHYDITQEELGKIAGVSDKAVSTWEIGTKEPRMGAVQKIADHFGLLKSNLIEDGGLDFLNRPQLTLSAFELETIKKFKALPESAQSTIAALIDIEYSKCNRPSVTDDEIERAINMAKMNTEIAE